MPDSFLYFGRSSVMVASVWFSRSILTPSLASTAWCSPSLSAVRASRRPELDHDDHLSVLDVDVEVVVNVRLRLAGRGAAGHVGRS